MSRCPFARAFASLRGISHFREHAQSGKLPLCRCRPRPYQGGNKHREFIRMKRSYLVAAALAAMATSVVAETTSLPLRKAGRWELTTSMDEGGKKHEQALTLCIDADMERNTAAASDVEHKSSCTKYEVKKDGDAVVVDATCKMNGRDVESRTEMRGDFQTVFEVKINSTTSGIDGARSISVPRTIVQQGKYIGEACGDLKAGEAMAPDGTKVMVQ
jgi:Protein of unknown function (DUF3617)